MTTNTNKELPSPNANAGYKVTWQSWLILIVLTLIWGSSFILMKKGLVAFSANQVAALRIFIAMLSLLPLLPSALKQIKRKDYGVLFLVALLGNGIPPFLFTTAQIQISSALTGLLNTMTPLFTFLIGLLFFGMVFKWRKMLGLLMGLLGAITLILFSTPYEAVGNNWYGAFVLMATLCYSVNIHLFKKYCQDLSPIAVNVIGFLLLGPWMGVYIFSTDFVFILQTNPEGWMSLFFIAILAILGTAFANILFYRLVQVTDALFSSMITYVIPIVAVGWGFLDGETIDYTYPIGMSFILLGVYLTSRSKK